MLVGIFLLGVLFLLPLSFIILLIKLFGGLRPCEVESVIDDILEHYGYSQGIEKKYFKNQLLYYYNYYNCDTHKKLLRKFKKLERELLNRRYDMIIHK